MVPLHLHILEYVTVMGFPKIKHCNVGAVILTYIAVKYVAVMGFPKIQHTEM